SLASNKPNVRVLVVDDDADALRATADILESAGYEVLTAATGEEALRLIDTRRPNVILLDLVLPGKDGFQVAAELSSRPDARDIPIVVVTALDVAQDKQAEKLQGVRRIIYKPCRPKTLLESIDDVLRYGG
ncbi:MAG: response regulator, partial [Planctomycetes bacterium]|nr:response regulator [Planctomycetota bacterium]